MAIVGGTVGTIAVLSHDPEEMLAVEEPVSIIAENDTADNAPAAAESKPAAGEKKKDKTSKKDKTPAKDTESEKADDNAADESKDEVPATADENKNADEAKETKPAETKADNKTEDKTEVTTKKTTTTTKTTTKATTTTTKETTKETTKATEPAPAPTEPATEEFVRTGSGWGNAEWESIYWKVWNDGKAGKISTHDMSNPVIADSLAASYADKYMAFKGRGFSDITVGTVWLYNEETDEEYESRYYVWVYDEDNDCYKFIAN